MTPPMWLIQLLAVIAKEVKQTVQDRRMVFLLTLAPLLQLVAFGYAINMEVDDIPTTVVDLDRSPSSRELVRAVTADGTLREVALGRSADEANADLEGGVSNVALIVPEGFERDLTRGDPALLQLLLDGAEPNRSMVANGAVARYALAASLRTAQQRVATVSQGRITLPVVDVRTRLLFNPTLASAVYFVPGIAGMLLLIVTTMVTAMGFAREVELGTMEQVRVTPIPTPVLLIGKVFPFVAVGLADVMASLVAGAIIFDVPLRGSLPLFFATTSLYLLTTVGLGLLVATISETQQQAFISAYLVILPAMLLSGTLTPIHAMPTWMQPITLLNPLRYFMASVRAILIKGATAADIAPNLAALAVYGAVILTLAATRFRKRLA